MGRISPVRALAAIARARALLMAAPSAKGQGKRFREGIMTLADIFRLLLLLAIILNVLALALETRAPDFVYLIRNWRLGLRAFVAMFIVVPAVAILIAFSFDLKPPVKIAMIALAFSPVPPLLPRKQLRAGGHSSYIVGLLVAAAMVSLVVAPLGLELAGAIFSRDTNLSALRIARILAIGIAMPLALGLMGQRLLGDRTSAVATFIAKTSTIVLLVGLVILLAVAAPAIWEVIGDGTILALVAMVVVGLAAGYWLAGNVPENRIALSLAAATRHPGFAITIATSSFPGEKLAPAAILLFVVLNALVTMPYLRRMTGRQKPADRDAPA